MGKHFLRLRLGHVDAVARGQVLLIEVAVALSGLGKDRNDMPQYIGNDAVTRRMKARDFDLLLTRAPVPHEGMSIARGGACAEIDVIDPLARGLRLGGGCRGAAILRARRLNL